MRPSVEVHDALARLVEYPREGYAQVVEAAADDVSAGCPAAAALLAPFLEHVRGTSLGELEEAFSRTFDNTSSIARTIELMYPTGTQGTKFLRRTYWISPFVALSSSSLSSSLSISSSISSHSSSLARFALQSGQFLFVNPGLPQE